MASPLSSEAQSLDDFLAWEGRQAERYERVGGVVRMMVGGTLNHNRIIRNVARLLEGVVPSACEVFTSDVKVVTPKGDVMYPDAVVACGELEGRTTSLDAPVVVVEVLSPSTEKQDHTHKRWAYQTVPSLRHYVLIGQDEPVFEVASWQDDGTWRSVIHRDLDARIVLAAISLELPAREIFSRVTFETAIGETA
jgi:Uma2 family endonuclease